MSKARTIGGTIMIGGATVHVQHRAGEVLAEMSGPLVMKPADVNRLIGLLTAARMEAERWEPPAKRAVGPKA